MPPIGMDVDNVRLVARQVAQEADRLEGEITAIGNRISGASWTGPDRDRFVADWNHQRNQVRNVCQILRDASSTMLRNAQEQEQTSSR